MKLVNPIKRDAEVIANNYVRHLWKRLIKSNRSAAVSSVALLWYLSDRFH